MTRTDIAADTTASHCEGCGCVIGEGVPYCFECRQARGISAIPRPTAQPEPDEPRPVHILACLREAFGEHDWDLDLPSAATIIGAVNDVVSIEDNPAAAAREMAEILNRAAELFDDYNAKVVR